MRTISLTIPENPREMDQWFNNESMELRVFIKGMWYIDKRDEFLTAILQFIHGERL